MPDKNRKYALVVLYDPAGNVQSFCLSETPGQAKSIRRTYQRHHAERDGWKVVPYPAGSRKDALRMTPPPLLNNADTSTACTGHASQAVGQNRAQEAMPQE